MNTIKINRYITEHDRDFLEYEENGINKLIAVEDITPEMEELYNYIKQEENQ